MVSYGMLHSGQTTAEVCYGVLQRVKEHHRGLLRNGTKGQTTSEVWLRSGVTRVKQHKRIVHGVLRNGFNNIRGLLRSDTNGSKNITDFLRNGTKGQTTSEVC